MAGVTSIIIKESAEELEKLLKKEKEAKNKERIQVLYWLKQEKAPTITEIAKSLGRNRATVQKWLTKYKEEKLEGLLKRKKSEGRVRVIPKWAEESLRKKLTEKEGFRSYKEVQKWLEESLGVVAKYHAVYQMTRHRLKGKLKVPRPRQIKQNKKELEAFKKTLVQI